MTEPEKTPQELAREYAHWVAPEMVAMLEKALIFIKKYPQMFPNGEEEKTVETIQELKDMLKENV